MQRVASLVFMIAVAVSIKHLATMSLVVGTEHVTSFFGLRYTVRLFIFVQYVLAKPTDIRPPFNEETARAKVKAAQYAWNSKNPELVAHAYAADSRWRNRTEFFAGRQAIVEFLKRKWSKELDYHLMKELWCYTGNRISVRFEYEWRDADNPNQWMRTHGNEHWEFDEDGLMRIRDMSANDYPIRESERRYR